MENITKDINIGGGMVGWSTLERGERTSSSCVF